MVVDRNSLAVVVVDTFAEVVVVVDTFDFVAVADTSVAVEVDHMAMVTVKHTEQTVHNFVVAAVADSLHSFEIVVVVHTVEEQLFVVVLGLPKCSFQLGR